MTTLSEKLHLSNRERIAYMVSQGESPSAEADRRATVEAVIAWLEARRRLGKAEAWSADLIRRELLGGGGDGCPLPSSADPTLEWRRLLWLRHGCPREALYGDDGEMSCGRCCIDFARMTPSEVEGMWWKEIKRSLAAAAPVPDEGGGPKEARRGGER